MELVAKKDDEEMIGGGNGLKNTAKRGAELYQGCSFSVV